MLSLSRYLIVNSTGDLNSQLTTNHISEEKVLYLMLFKSFNWASTGRTSYVVFTFILSQPVKWIFTIFWHWNNVAEPILDSWHFECNMHIIQWSIEKKDLVKSSEKLIAVRKPATYDRKSIITWYNYGFDVYCEYVTRLFRLIWPKNSMKHSESWIKTL